jgi:hypothetical protein
MVPYFLSKTGVRVRSFSRSGFFRIIVSSVMTVSNFGGIETGTSSGRQAPVIGCFARALMRPVRVVVLCLSGDPVLLGHPLGVLSHERPGGILDDVRRVGSNSLAGNAARACSRAFHAAGLREPLKLRR